MSFFVLIDVVVLIVADVFVAVVAVFFTPQPFGEVMFFHLPPPRLSPRGTSQKDVVLNPVDSKLLSNTK